MVALFQRLQGELRVNEPLAKHTSWRVGGTAQHFYRPTDVDDLVLFLSQVSASESIIWLGLGSNLLVRDGGFAGTVVAAAGVLNNVEVSDQLISAEVGVSCAKLAKIAARSNLSGLAFLAGIPGTLGGALAMNAGAYQSEIWTLVQEVATVDRQGVLRQRKPADFDVSYRQVNLPAGEWFVSAVFALPKGDAQRETLAIKALLKSRSVNQPINQPCAGSVFRNPKNDFAGRLIESTGLKGTRIGGAHVSDKHANFIINDGTATATDIEALIKLIQQKIELIHGVTLSPEVHIVGEAEW